MSKPGYPRLVFLSLDCDPFIDVRMDNGEPVAGPLPWELVILVESPGDPGALSGPPEDCREPTPPDWTFKFGRRADGIERGDGDFDDFGGDPAHWGRKYEFAWAVVGTAVATALDAALEANLRSPSGTLEAFEMTEARGADNSEWPNWLHEAWNNEAGGKPRLRRAQDEPGSELVLATGDGTFLVHWGDYLVRDTEGRILLWQVNDVGSFATVDPRTDALGNRDVDLAKYGRRVASEWRWGRLGIMGNEAVAGRIREVHELGVTFAEVEFVDWVREARIGQGDDDRRPIYFPAQPVPASRKQYAPGAFFDLVWCDEAEARAAKCHKIPFGWKAADGVTLPAGEVGWYAHVIFTSSGWPSGPGWVLLTQPIAPFLHGVMTTTTPAGDLRSRAVGGESAAHVDSLRDGRGTLVWGFDVPFSVEVVTETLTPPPADVAGLLVLIDGDGETVIGTHDDLGTHSLYEEEGAPVDVETDPSFDDDADVPLARADDAIGAFDDELDPNPKADDEDDPS